MDNDDDFSDFVAHRITPSNPPAASASSNVEFFSNNDIPTTPAISPQKSSNVDLFNTNQPTKNNNVDLFNSHSDNSNVDLFNIPNPTPVSTPAVDLFQLNNQNDFFSNKPAGNDSVDNKLVSDMELLDFTGSSNKSMIPSMTMPNLSMVCKTFKI